MRPIATVAAVLVLLGSSSLAALAADDGRAIETAVGTDGGTIVYDDTIQEPDNPTIIYVGGDSNTMVTQPNLSLVPSTGDGIFTVSAPSISVPVSGDGVIGLVDPATGPSCAAYPTWYDAQLALESSTDPLLIAALDPDADGIACEDVMQ